MSLLVERGQLGDRVDQLCHVLADRDGTIQRLEEDLLRIRMVGVGVETSFNFRHANVLFSK